MSNAYDFWPGTLIVSYVVTLQFKCSYLAIIGGIFTISMLTSVYSLRHDYFTFHVSVSRYSLISKNVYSVISHTLVNVFLDWFRHKDRKCTGTVYRVSIFSVHV